MPESAIGAFIGSLWHALGMMPVIDLGNSIDHLACLAPG